MCLRLGRLFGTTPQFWMNMQSKVDIWGSLALHEDEVMAIEPIEIAAIASAELADPIKNGAPKA